MPVHNNVSLLDISKRHRRSITILLNGGDDGVLQDAAYFTQQMIEKLIMYMYECVGARHTFGHDIADLLTTLPDWKMFMSEDIYNRLLERADTLTLWESETRYPGNYLAVRDAVQDTVEIADTLLFAIEQYLPSGTSVKEEHTRKFAQASDLDLFGK